MNRPLLSLSLAAFSLLGAGCLTSPVAPQTIPNVPAAIPPADVAPAPTPTAAPSPTAAPAPAKTTTKPKTVAPTPTPTPAPAPTYPVTFVSDQMSVSAIINAYGASLSWGKTKLTTFKAYAIMKSTTDSSPFYPKTEAAHYSYDKDSTQWNDTNVQKGVKTYYRVCAIAADDTVTCGSVTSITK
jgi:outer membrane biosynthesis protein TonB